MTREITLTGADGVQWDLAAGPIVLAAPFPALHGTIPVTVSERIAPLLPGSFVTQVRHQARDVMLPLAVLADTTTELDQTLHSLARTLDPAVGSVAVMVTRSDGTRRQIEGLYVAGFEALALAHSNAMEVTANIAIRCHEEPYWVDPSGTTIEVDPPPDVFTSGTTSTDDTATGTDDPIPTNGFVVGIDFNSADYGFSAVLPFSGDAGGVVITTLVNDGDADAWPLFTITGPASAIQATNITTGKFWTWDGSLDNAKVLTVDTRPGRRDVNVDGTNRFGTLEDGSSLWALQPGSQVVAFRFDGTTDPGSKFVVSWTERYLTC